MAHTLLEQEWEVKSGTTSVVNATAPFNFIINILGLTTESSTTGDRPYPINSGGDVAFICNSNVGSSTYNALCLCDKAGKVYNIITTNKRLGSIFYHISTAETVKYFKYVQSDESAENSYTYILAEDVNGDWVVFNGDKMYSDYGATGIYNNPQIGRPELVDIDNQFMVSKAHRFDTGTEFKELYFVSSAKSYSDTNCIVNFGGKTYRLVSVSNEKDETGRYPAFAFPVSD